jgi:hypothetical protein
MHGWRPLARFMVSTDCCFFFIGWVCEGELTIQCHYGLDELLGSPLSLSQWRRAMPQESPWAGRQLRESFAVFAEKSTLFC